MTLVPWTRGRALVWDYTCVDTMANSNREVTSAAGGGAAENAFRKKEAKYQDISKDFFFMPVAMETFGAWARESLDFIRDLGRRICRRTGEVRSTAFLLQRISIAVQKANAASIISALPCSEELETLYYC